MAKKKIESITYDCSKCIESILDDGKLHCKIKIKDLTKPFTHYSEVKMVKDCGYYKGK